MSAVSSPLAATNTQSPATAAATDLPPLQNPAAAAADVTWATAAAATDLSAAAASVVAGDG